jgi:hypothetical protein
MSLLVALLLAAQPAPATPANADLTALYDSVCTARGEPGADFRPVTSSEIPADLRDMYIGPQQGHYWRREGERPAFVILARGPGHWGGIEEYCVVGVQGATFEALVHSLSRRLNDHSIFRRDGTIETTEHWGRVNVGLEDRVHRTHLMITQRPDRWVSLFTGGQVTAATTRWGVEGRDVNVDSR